MPIGLRHRGMRTNLRLINSFDQVIHLLRYASLRVWSQPKFAWHTLLYKIRARKTTGNTNPKGSYKELFTERIPLFVAGTFGKSI